MMQLSMHHIIYLTWMVKREKKEDACYSYMIDFSGDFDLSYGNEQQVNKDSQTCWGQKGKTIVKIGILQLQPGIFDD